MLLLVGVVHAGFVVDVDIVNASGIDFNVHHPGAFDVNLPTIDLNTSLWTSPGFFPCAYDKNGVPHRCLTLPAVVFPDENIDLDACEAQGIPEPVCLLGHYHRGGINDYNMAVKDSRIAQLTQDLNVANQRTNEAIGSRMDAFTTTFTRSQQDDANVINWALIIVLVLAVSYVILLLWKKYGHPEDAGQTIAPSPAKIRQLREEHDRPEPTGITAAANNMDYGELVAEHEAELRAERAQREAEKEAGK